MRVRLKDLGKRRVQPPAGIEPRFVGWPARSLATVPTELRIVKHGDGVKCFFQKIGFMFRPDAEYSVFMFSFEIVSGTRPFSCLRGEGKWRIFPQVKQALHLSSTDF